MTQVRAINPDLQVNVTKLADALWTGRGRLSALSSSITSLHAQIGLQGDLHPYQWAQLMAMVWEFRPDLILELGRGGGNSTCAFNLAIKHLETPCRILSLCRSNRWRRVSLPRVIGLMGKGWCDPVDARETDILTVDYVKDLKGHQRILLFWDAHGFDVAECVLGGILPLISAKPHLVIMHDLSDERYLAPETRSYQGRGLWRGNTDDGRRVRLGEIDSAVEQAVAITDFASRNRIQLHSATAELHEAFDHNAARQTELAGTLGADLFSLEAHWFWFSLNEGRDPFTFPAFQPPVKRPSLLSRIKRWVGRRGCTF